MTTHSNLTGFALLLALACNAFAAPPPKAPTAPAPQYAQYKIVTASKAGTYIQIGRDLAKWVAEPAGIGLEVMESKGSAENVRRMRFEPGVKLALVQSDVFQAFLDEAKAGNAEAGKIIRPLRVIMPLYDEEIYFVVRADSPLNAIHEIRNKKIGVGPIGSGTAQVTCDDKVFLLTENQSTYIPIASVHRLANPGKIPLEIIEVQSGSYLGEDDIERLDDVYGRAPQSATVHSIAR